MSRFGEGDYDGVSFANQSEFWWANTKRALMGRKGQRALSELREALVALPEPVLVSGRLATEAGQVCTVGALIVHRRVSKGEEREAVLRELAAKLTDDDDPDGALLTTDEGVAVGLTFVLAWRLAQLNDEDFEGYAPEQRYTAVLAWIDRQLVPVAA